MISPEGDGEVDVQHLVGSGPDVLVGEQLLGAQDHFLKAARETGIAPCDGLGVDVQSRNLVKNVQQP